MRIESVKIENLRAFCRDTVRLNDYTCLVGPNGAGKSTVLTALNIFFRDTAASSLDLLNLCEEDFHQQDIDTPIKITVTFTDLSEEAQEDFRAYFRHGKLVVSAEAKWNPKSGCAEVRQFGERMVMADFSQFFKAEGDNASAATLKTLYAQCRLKCAELSSANTKQAMHDALAAYEAQHPELCTLQPSEDQFYGFSRGDNLLRKYIRWIYIPAVKDASVEGTEAKKSALGQLLELTVRSRVRFNEPLEGLRGEMSEKYGQILKENQDKLEELSGSLTDKFRDWTNQDTRLKLRWHADPTNAIRISEPLAEVIAGEGKFDGKIARMGHGMQRCFLLTLLQELSGCEASKGPKLILGCEEPELYQHPPQARHLADVLQKLCEKNAQVIISTHSPYFVSGKVFEDVRVVRKDRQTQAACSYSITLEQLSAAIAAAKGSDPAPLGGTLFKIHQALQPGINEIFFSPMVVLVEGLEDVAYITSYLILLNGWDDFRRHGCHIVPVNGKSQLIQPLAAMNHFEIPYFCVFDSDAHQRDSHGSRNKHEIDNRAILNLCRVPTPDPFPADTLWRPNCVMWKSELGDVVRQEFGKNWDSVWGECQRVHDARVPDMAKNGMFIGSLMEIAWNRGIKSPSLEKLCSEILNHAVFAAGISGAKPTERVETAVRKLEVVTTPLSR